MDQIQAEAGRPRASYKPPQLDEAGLVKFINKEAAKQRRAKVNRMAGVASGQQALRSYTAAQKEQCRRASRHPPMRKKKPAKQKTCLTLMELAQAFPNIRQQVCFHPKQYSDLQFLSGTGPSQQTESDPVAIKKEHAPSDVHPPSPHHEQHPTLNAHQRSDRRVSQKFQQQFEDATARTSHLTGRSMVCHVDVPDCTRSRTEQWRNRHESSYHCHSIYP